MAGPGSPPRVRGKVSERGSYFMMTRITPACAGKRSGQSGKIFACEDHPRVCGEKNDSFSAGGTIAGSPPRVRGKVSHSFLVSLSLRITPACAGKRSRVRRPMITILGSPPRVRGKVHHVPGLAGIARITPACAGKRLKKALKNKDF